MKRVFRIKTLLLSALLCVAGFGVKAQIADESNATGCDVIVRFYAVDPFSCSVVATDPGPYTIPAGTPPYILVPMAWNPGPPVGQYIIVAEVAYAACGFPGVFVAPPIAPCGYVPGAAIPPCPGCAPGNVDNASGVFPPGGGARHFQIYVHP